MKFLVSGYYGFKNLGDELILLKIIEDIKSIDSDATIMVYSGDINYTMKVQNVTGINRFSFEDVIKAVKNSDVVVVGGGGLIHEYFEIDITDIFKSFGYNVASYCIVPLIAKIFQKPVFYWCHGVGPIFTEEGRSFAKWFYTLSEFITLRDADSLDLLKKIYPGVKNAYVDTDPTIGFDVRKFIRPIQLGLPEDKIKIGLNIRPWFGIEGIIGNLSAALNELHRENRNIVIIPIPFDLSLDSKVLRKLVTSLSEGSVWEYEFDKLDTPEEVISLMNDLDFFIGVRLHSIIVSSLLKIPTLSISYDIKTDEFSNLLKIPSIRIEDLAKNNLLIHIRSLLNMNRMNLKDLEYDYKTPEYFRDFVERVNSSCAKKMELHNESSGEVVSPPPKKEVLTYEYFIKTLESEIHELIEEKDNLSNQLNWSQGILNGIYASDFWKVASLYYKVRDRSIVLRSIHNLSKWVKRKIKNSPYSEYPSKFALYAKRYGVRAAIKKSFLKITGRGFSKVFIPATEAKISRVSEIYGGGIRDRVSVILPVYNQANYLKEAIDGFLNQTYKDIELIIINDGSTDSVEKVLDMYVTHPKVKIFAQENQKLPRALNNGFEHATGEFFTWTSADNIMIPNQIEELVRFLKENPDAEMVFSDYQAINDRGLPLNDPTFRPHNQDKGDRSIMRLPNIVTFENLHDSGDNFIGPSFMYRRHVAKIIGDYAHDTFGGEDYDYWLRLNSLFKIKHLNKILYKYRVHDDTLNAKAKELNLFENIRRLLERDRLRKNFYQKMFNIIWVGFEQKSHHLALDDKILLIFKYSWRNSPEVIKNLGRSNVASICVIDEEMDEYSIDDEILKVSDYIITTDFDNFDVLYPLYGNKLFNVGNIEGNIELLVKMANSNLFNREMKLSYEKKPASVCLEKRRLNIAFQVENFDRGGLEQVVYDLATCIGRERFNLCGVIVVNQDGMMGDKLKSKGIDVLKVNNSSDAYKSLLRNKKIDIVNSHYSYFGLDKAAELGIGVVETIHNSYTWLDKEKVNEINCINRFIDKHVTVSRQVRNYHRRRFGIPSGRIEVIPNGLNLEGLNETGRNKFTRTSLGCSERDFIFLNVASFNGIKCHHLMISAIKELIGNYPDIKLIFIGDILDRGLYNDICERIKAESLEGNIKIMDFLDRIYLKDPYKMADCFILPSIQEGWSIAAMEAMFFALPLILTDIGSARDIIEDNDIGIIVDNPYSDILTLSSHDILELSKKKSAKNLSELKKAMLTIYKDRELWKEKARKGREKVRSEFNLKKMIKRYEDAFIRTFYIDRKTRMGEGNGNCDQTLARTVPLSNTSSSWN